MLRKKTSIAILVCLGLVFLGVGLYSYLQPSKLSEVGEYQIHIQKAHFDIDLASNSSTGYSWVVSENNTPYLTLDPIEEYSDSEDSTIVGSPGYSRLTGTVKQDGIYHLQLDYRQDWDGGESEIAYQVEIESIDGHIKQITLTEI